MEQNKIGMKESGILKGLAIIAVIMTHANQKPYELLGGLSFIDYYVLGRIGVSLFLFLSGYGVYKSYRKNGLAFYWENKVLKIMIPYTACHVIWFIIAYAKGERFEYKDLLPSFIGIRPTSIICFSMWYISFTWFLYFVFFIIFTILPEKMIIYSMILCSVFLMIITPFIWPGGFFCSILFPMGVLYSRLDEKICSDLVDIKKAYIALIILGLSLCFYYCFSYNHFVLNCLMLLMSLSLIFIVKTVRLSCFERITTSIGGISYYLYLIHLKIIELTAYICNKNGYVNNSRLVLFAIGVCVMIIISYLMKIAHEKVMKTITHCRVLL